MMDRSLAIADCFQHVLVDGAEELTPRQVAFLERIVGQSGSLVVTADPSQAISAEADQLALTYLLEAWPAMRVYHLRASHQTTRRLARVAATLRGDLDGTHTPEVIPDPDSPGGEDPKLVLVEGILQDMDVHCLNELWRLHQEGGGLGGHGRPGPEGPRHWQDADPAPAPGHSPPDIGRAGWPPFHRCPVRSRVSDRFGESLGPAGHAPGGGIKLPEPGAHSSGRDLPAGAVGGQGAGCRSGHSRRAGPGLPPSKKPGPSVAAHVMLPP